MFSSLRAGQWAHFLVLPLAGVDTSLELSAGGLACARGVLIAFAVLAYGYLLNGLSDRDVDRDRTKNPLAGFRGSVGTYRACVIGLAASALALAAMGPTIGLVATGVALASGAVYSVGPRLKRIPGVGTLLNVTCFAPLLFVGMADDSVVGPRWALAAVFAGLLIQNQLVHEASDAPEDRAAAVFTSFVVLGPVRTAFLSLAAGVGIGAASLWLLGLRAAPLALAAHALPYVTVFPLLLALYGRDPRRMDRLRRAHRIASILSGAMLLLVTVSG